jgi:hypothetical protein
MQGLARRTLSMAAVLWWFAAPTAHAAEPGFTVDPQSPSGTEYAIPLDQARSSAGHVSDAGSGTTRSGGGPSAGAPLFGVGVSRGGSGAGSALPGGGSAASGGATGSAGGAGGATAGSGTQHGGGASSEGGARAQSLLPSVLRQAAANPGSGPGTPLMVAGVAAGTVLAGVLLGLMLRRRRLPGPWM